MRLDGRETLFVTGMDEHGLKVQQTAAREGVTPQAFVDRIAAQFEAMGELLNARADDIVRTTQARHDRARAGDLGADGGQRRHLSVEIRRLVFGARRGLFRRGRTDRRAGRRRSSRRAARRSQWVEEESYFFSLSAYADQLLAHYEANPEFITPENYRNEIVAFVKRGLTDLSISRTDLRLGRAGARRSQARHVRLGRRADQLHHRDRLSRRRRRGAKFWPADAHVIGKDITRFHAIYWPAFLMSAGLPLPRQIVVHGFLFNRGEKMSKSVGNVIESGRPGRGLRRRPAALFLPARGAVRPGRQLFARGDRPAHQRRSRQRSRQSRAALAVDDRQELRRRRAGLARGGARRRRSRDARRAPTRLVGVAREHMQRLRAPSLSRRGVRRRRRGEPLFRRRRAVEAGQDRSGAHARSSSIVTVETLRVAAHPAAAGHAGRDGEAARSAGRSRRTRVRFVDAGAEQPALAAPGLARAGADLPALRRRRIVPRATSSPKRGRARADALIDSHCHLDFPDFADEIEGVVARAQRGGRRAHDHDLDAGRQGGASSPQSPSASTASISPSAPIRIRRRRARRPIAGAIRALRRASQMRRHRRGGARLSLQLRAAPTSPSASSAPRSRWRANSGCRSSSTPARPTTTSRRS